MLQNFWRKMGLETKKDNVDLLIHYLFKRNIRFISMVAKNKRGHFTRNVIKTTTSCIHRYNGSDAKHTPSNALDAILHLLPLYEFVQLEAHKSFLRLNRSNKFKSGNLVHLHISQLIQCGPVITMHEDWMKTVDHYDFLYYVCDTTRTVWDDGGPNVRQSPIKSFTDGSKIETQTGADIYGPGTHVSVAVGDYQQYYKR